MSIVRVLLLGLVFLPALVDAAAAQPGSTTSASGSVQIFALTTSDGASCTNPPGPCGALVSLPIDVKANSLLTITFSARGLVSPSSTQTVEVAINCDVDGNPCEPDANGVEFLYPTFCCDARSFTWISPAGKGAHTVRISWTTQNSGTASIQNRTLHVEAVPTK
jgi:hypothetical protein